VTMQVKGVSRQVSVSLEEVDEFVPDVMGQANAIEGAEASPAPVEEVVTEVEARAVDVESGEPIVEIVPPGGAPADPDPEDEVLGAASEPPVEEESERENAPAG